MLTLHLVARVVGMVEVVLVVVEAVVLVVVEGREEGAHEGEGDEVVVVVVGLVNGEVAVALRAKQDKPATKPVGNHAMSTRTRLERAEVSRRQPFDLPSRQSLKNKQLRYPPSSTSTMYASKAV